MFYDIGYSESALQDRISILFFTNGTRYLSSPPYINMSSSFSNGIIAFLTFMSVAAIPAFIQERAVFIRERTNAHYGPAAYAAANTISQVYERVISPLAVYMSCMICTHACRVCARV
jgi:hypothetical protein